MSKPWEHFTNALFVNHETSSASKVLFMSALARFVNSNGSQPSAPASPGHPVTQNRPLSLDLSPPSQPPGLDFSLTPPRLSLHQASTTPTANRLFAESPRTVEQNRRRRHRRNSDPSEPSPRAQKKLKDYATHVCHELELQPGSLNEFIKVNLYPF